METEKGFTSFRKLFTLKSLFLNEKLSNFHW